MGKRKLVWLLVLVVLLGLFAVFVLRRANTPGSSAGVRLPDGSRFRLDKVDFKSGAHYFKAQGSIGWKALALKVLPKNLTDRLRLFPMGGSVRIGGGMGTNLAASTVLEGSVKSPHTALRLVVSDELGNSFDGGTTHGVVSSSDGFNQMRLDGWIPEAFPHRGKTLRLSYYDYNFPNGGHPIAEFTVPNPAYANYSVWTPETLPATKTNGDLTITLASLKAGLSKQNPSRPASSNEVAATQAAFKIVQAGHETNAWRPKGAEIWDATGNHWFTYPQQTTYRSNNGTNYMTFQGALWPGEAAWKMKFEFIRTADFAPDETCTFSGIVPPGATQVINLENRTNIGYVTVALIAISGEKRSNQGI